MISRRSTYFWAAVATLGLVSLACSLVLAFEKAVNHDEYQHVAAGLLFAHEGLLPYRDYPYFHTPYLVFIYGAVFRFSDHPFLVARLLSGAAAAATAITVGFVGASLFRRGSLASRLAISVAATSLLLTAPLFLHTVGRAWNQEPSVLLVVLAVVWHLAGARLGNGRWLFLSGVLLGSAIGLRITTAPLVLPFLILICFSPTSAKPKAYLLAAFAGGLALALLPLLILFCLAPKQFLFGNFEFAHVNVVYREATGSPRTMTFLKKARFVAKNVVRPNAVLAVAVLSCALAAWIGRRGSEKRMGLDFRFVLLLLPFLLMGSMAPSPIFYQYFYIALPIVVLGALYALASCEENVRAFHLGRMALLMCALLSTSMGVLAYRKILRSEKLGDTAPLELHRDALKLKDTVPFGRVLTLAPLLPLEAGLSIYPALTTGPFAWRVTSFVEATRRTELGLVGPQELNLLLEREPPSAVLLGFEKPDWEAPLLSYARQNGYRQVHLRGKSVVWLPPLVAPSF